jgi:hypothetical protein
MNNHGDILLLYGFNSKLLSNPLIIKFANMGREESDLVLTACKY